MSMRKTLATCALICSAVTGSSARQATPPAALSVYVSHSGSDSVGAQIVYATRELLRSSRAYPLTTEQDAKLIVSVVSIDTSNAGRQGDASALAVVLLTNTNPRNYITHWVMNYCSTRVQEAANVLIANLDNQVEKARAQ